MTSCSVITQKRKKKNGVRKKKNIVTLPAGDYDEKLNVTATTNERKFFGS